MYPNEPERKTFVYLPANRRGHDASVPRVPQVGEDLGRYRLCLEIAKGGMATVFLARTEGRSGLHRFVALKCIRPELARDPRFVGMFTDEAAILTRLHHANICSVYDFDQIQGAYYLAMEYLQGETLAAVYRKLCESSSIYPPEHQAGIVARIVADAAEGLHAAHELRDSDGKSLNVVHRDVSPPNIFVTYHGNVKIVDFGVACGSHQQHKTQTGMLKGKYAYIQPEVLHGAKPDRRADIWGLGVVTWELLTLRRLFDADTDVHALQAVTSKEIPPPSSVRSSLPGALDEIVLRALDRDPRKRYESAREFGRKMTQFLTEHKLAIGLAELSEFMDRLFPSGRACQEQLLDVAGQLDQASPDTVMCLTSSDRIPLLVDPSSSVRSVRSVRAIRPDARPESRRPGRDAGSSQRGWRLAAWAPIGVAAILAALVTFALSASLSPQRDAAAAPRSEAAADPAAPARTPAPALHPGARAAGDYVLEVTPASDPTTLIEDGVLLRVRMVPVTGVADHEPVITDPGIAP